MQRLQKLGYVVGARDIHQHQAKQRDGGLPGPAISCIEQKRVCVGGYSVRALTLTVP